MKRLLLGLFGLSLTGNLFLLGWEFQERAQRTGDQTTLSGLEVRPAEAKAHFLPSNIWIQIQAGDPRALAALRREGFSDELARAAIRAQIAVKFREREQALYPNPRSLRYWRNELRLAYGPSSRAAVLDIWREKKELTEKILGPAEDENLLAASNPRTEFLSPEKAKHVQAITEEYNAMAADLRGVNSSYLLPSEREKLIYLEKEKRDDLTQVLTPEELAEYDLRASPTANSLRFQLGPFNPSQDEFRAIYDIQKNVPQSNLPSDYRVLSADDRAAGAKAQMAADAEIKTRLGDERFAEYQRSKDHEFQSLYEIGTRLELPRENAVEAYKLKISLEEILFEARDERPGRTSESYNETLSAVSEEAKAAFSRLLSPDGYEAFRAHSSLFSNFKPLPVPRSSTDSKP